MPGIGTAIAGVGAVVGVISDHLSLRKEGSQNTYW
jgi:hypothetical protein